MTTQQRELRDVTDFLSASGGTEGWLTPRAILDALGPFDLDPCAAPGWPTAARHICRPDDGLGAAWAGRVWLNPPYGPDAARWVAKLAGHGCGTALIFGRYETEWFADYVWERASAVRLLLGRVQFIRQARKQAPGHNAPAPSVLVAYGSEDARRLEHCGLPGVFVPDWALTRKAPEGKQAALFGGAA